MIVANSGPYLMHLNPYSRNGPDLDNRILYAADVRAANLDTIANHPERTPYLEVTSDPLFDDPVAYHDAPVPTVTVIPLRVVHGTNLTLRVRVTNSSGAPVVVASLRVGHDTQVRTLANDASKGDTFETEWTLTPAELTAPLGEIRIDTGSGATVRDARSGHREQLFYSYRLDGTGTIDVLYPGRKLRVTGTGRQLERHEVTSLRDLDVELTMNQ